MKTAIASLEALEILDSRGTPTLSVTVILEDGRRACASVPSGASTGEHEAHELRDGDPLRHRGKGVLKAAANVIDLISPALRGLDVTEQSRIDRTMIDLDGTANKTRLGANATVGVSMAVARMAAMTRNLPLYRHLAGSGATVLPVPMMNVINGGKHAQNGVEFQEFMIVPHGAPNFAEALRYGAETYAALRETLVERGYATGVGDEGGFAPDLGDNARACSLIVEAIEAAGFEPGGQISIALDPAASSFAHEGGYIVPSLMAGKLDADRLGALYADWAERFPIVSIEDGFAENDWPAFAKQTAALGDRVQIVGDDLYVTNRNFIVRGVAEQSTNAVLIKLNQIGTVTETIEAIDECRKAGWRFVVSHRSGETDDHFIADFAVAMGGGQIKTGAPCRGERTAKYNRLLAISHELGADATFARPFDRPQA